MNSWNSYPSIYNLGHRAVKDLLTVPVNVEEKIDGSQFSFGKNEFGELLVRSKGATMWIDAPEKMFSNAAETVKSISDLLVPGWTYRGEYLRAPKHNTLRYSRIPNKHIIIFDINTSEETYLLYEDKCAEAARLGLETVPLLYSGKLDSLERFREFLDRESVLGGPKIEGVVVKPVEYNLYGPDRKVLFGKFVSEHFKEIHQQTWKTDNPTSKDIVVQLGEAYQTPARWQKAVMHLAERGEIESSPHDIAKLIKEVPQDILKEEETEIKDALFKWAWPSIRRLAVAGLPEWYKEELVKKQFDD